MLSIKRYGEATSAVMLTPLLHLDVEFIETNSFTPIDDAIGQKKINQQLIRLENANDAAHSQMDDLTECRDALASHRLQVGYHHHSLMLLSDDIEHLQKQTLQAIRRYSDVGDYGHPRNDWIRGGLLGAIARQSKNDCAERPDYQFKFCRLLPVT